MTAQDHVKMNMDILNVIHTVIDYKKFLFSYHVMMFNDKQFDTAAEAEKFYYGICTLPEGMNRNHSDFNRIISYEYNNRKRLSELDNLEIDELTTCDWK